MEQEVKFWDELTGQQQRELFLFLDETPHYSILDDAIQNSKDIMSLVCIIHEEYLSAQRILDESIEAFREYWREADPFLRDRLPDLLRERICSKIHELHIRPQMIDDSDRRHPKGKLHLFHLIEGKRIGNPNWQRVGPLNHEYVAAAERLIERDGSRAYRLLRRRGSHPYSTSLLSAIASELGVSVATVRRRLVKKGWQMPVDCFYRNLRSS